MGEFMANQKSTEPDEDPETGADSAESGVGDSDSSFLMSRDAQPRGDKPALGIFGRMERPVVHFGRGDLRLPSGWLRRQRRPVDDFEWRTTASEVESEETDHPTLTIARCRGVMVGDNGAMDAEFQYTIEEPEIDLLNILEREDVRRALEDLGPGNSDGVRRAARTKAVQALRAGRWFARFSSRIPVRRTDLRESARSNLVTSGFAGAVVIRHCQGVRTGDGARQRVTFHYVCSAGKIDAADLLAQDRALAVAVVDLFSGRLTTADLDTALQKTIRGHRDVRRFTQPDVTVVDSRTSGLIRDRDAVVAGSDNEVRTSVDVAASVEEAARAVARLRNKYRATRHDRAEREVSSDHVQRADDTNDMGGMGL